MVATTDDTAGNRAGGAARGGAANHAADAPTARILTYDFLKGRSVERLFLLVFSTNRTVDYAMMGSSLAYFSLPFPLIV